ncbi:hypothetical protein [Aminobacterium mobile]|uniref:hypothetical protein n=1 Tax=Aminobacterium mobile TaxID=81467 RepID=UPI002FDF770C
MDEAAARLETAALARNLLYSAWCEFSTIQKLKEKLMNGKEKFHDNGNRFNPRITRKF